MKIKFAFYVFLLLGITSTLTAQKFEAVSSNATDIAISPKDGTVYISPKTDLIKSVSCCS